MYNNINNYKKIIEQFLENKYKQKLNDSEECNCGSKCPCSACLGNEYKTGDILTFRFGEDCELDGYVESCNRDHIVVNLEDDYDIFEAMYKGKDVKLNQPSYDSDDSDHKFKVYVKKPDTGNVIKVSFGDPDMEIKRDDPNRRKSFRARHKCDQKSFEKDRDTAGYWSCQMWQADKSVSDMLK